ncbi:MAG TPA: nuclear transport factor 2 family protein [Alphaproteobacteria bacterium]|nr:nuclear transport factor 2 family protein [Alphaproteobacteria bacterium]
MTEQEMIDLAKRYFNAVDREDLDAVIATLTEDCVFTVETHGVRLQGREAIESMMRRLWANHAAVRHLDFVYVPAPGHDSIAVRFTVINTRHDGGQTRKSNCNFFEIRDGRFDRVAVYMAGENTLDTD